MNEPIGIHEGVSIVTEKDGRKKILRPMTLREKVERWIRCGLDPTMMYYRDKVAHGHKNGSVVVVLTHQVTGQKKVIEGGANMVVSTGNTYYAQLGAGVAATHAFSSIYLCTAGPTPVLTTSVSADFTLHAGVPEKAVTATYPKQVCVDPDNTGAGVLTGAVITWAYAWLAADGPFAAVQWEYISTAAGSDAHILQGYKWVAAWSKDIATSAKIFINHTLLGS